MIKTPKLGSINIHLDPDARHLKPINLDTGEQLHDVFLLDDQCGHYWVYQRNDNGNIVLNNETGLPQKDLCIGNAGFDPESIKKYAAVKRENMVVMNSQE